MTDEDRRELARRAGDGDLEAARRLVRLLEREQRAVLAEDTRLADVPYDVWGDLANMRGRATQAAAQALRRDPREVTLRDIASLSELDLLKMRDCGPKALAAIKRVLESGGLVLRRD